MSQNSAFTRRQLFQAGALSGAALLLAGCSTSSNKGGSGAAAAGTTALVLWVWPDGFGKVAIGSLSDLEDVSVRQDVIGGDFKQKLQTTLQAGSGLPDITGLKGEDIAYFASKADYFVDLNTLGADKHKGDYLAWKWEQATAADGRQLGIPIDIGPTALFYREDTFAANGLPSDPDELGAAIRGWDDYIALGKELLAKAPGTFLVRSAEGLFSIAWRQSGHAFIDRDGVFIGAEDHIRSAWDIAVEANAAGINGALLAQTADATAAVAQGKLPADFGASWHLADLMSDAPDTAGKWRVCAHPGDPTNYGGSFLGIPAKTKNQKQAFEVILKLLDAKNQAAEYADKGNFPAMPAAYDSPEVSGPVEFLGGQVAAKVFGEAAKTVRPLYEHPLDGAVSGPFSAELTLVEASGKDPETAWKDAVAQAERLARQNGITVK